MEENAVRAAITVRGTVQGVGFRWWTKTLAESLGITGKVWNMPDGSVAIEAQGSRRVVEEFIGSVSRGPSRSLVSRVETGFIPCESDSVSFRIVFL